MIEWIDVEKKLPPKDISFLGTDGKEFFVCEWIHELDDYGMSSWGECFYCGGASRISLTNEDSRCKKLRFWMPLPRSPMDF